MNAAEDEQLAPDRWVTTLQQPDWPPCGRVTDDVAACEQIAWETQCPGEGEEAISSFPSFLTR
jgi:hypothetical protein